MLLGADLQVVVASRDKKICNQYCNRRGWMLIDQHESTGSASMLVRLEQNLAQIEAVLNRIKAIALTLSVIMPIAITAAVWAYGHLAGQISKLEKLQQPAALYQLKAPMELSRAPQPSGYWGDAERAPVLFDEKVVDDDGLVATRPWSFRPKVSGLYAINAFVMIEIPQTGMHYVELFLNVNGKTTDAFEATERSSNRGWTVGFGGTRLACLNAGDAATVTISHRQTDSSSLFKVIAGPASSFSATLVNKGECPSKK